MIWRRDQTQISEHAKIRLIERFGCTKRKMQKVSDKAWLAPEPPASKVAQKRREHPYAHFRWLMGYIFVFSLSHLPPILVTVIGKERGNKLQQ